MCSCYLSLSLSLSLSLIYTLHLFCFLPLFFLSFPFSFSPPFFSSCILPSFLHPSFSFSRNLFPSFNSLSHSKPLLPFPLPYQYSASSYFITLFLSPTFLLFTPLLNLGTPLALLGTLSLISSFLTPTLSPYYLLLLPHSFPYHSHWHSFHLLLQTISSFAFSY